MNSPKPATLQERIAAIVSAAIVLTLIVYWIVQIKGVLHMLDLAAGH